MRVLMVVALIVDWLCMSALVMAFIESVHRAGCP